VRRTNAFTVQTEGGEDIKLPKSTADPTAAIVAEGVAITPNDPTFNSVILRAFGYKELVYVSRELVEDADVDITAILARLMGRAIGTAREHTSPPVRALVSRGALRTRTSSGSRDRP
jgi:HK97 family phage major capsid protein